MLIRRLSYDKEVDPLFNFAIFFGLVVGGVLLEIFFAQYHAVIARKRYKKYHYSLGRYLFLLLFPILATLFIFSRVGTDVVTVFVAFAVVGTFLEWLVGFSFHMVVGHRLWTYYRLNINTYTSLLAIPLWGLAGVLFWLLAKVFV